MNDIIEKDRVLHIIYKNITKIPNDIIALCNKYEGNIKTRIGFNIPMSFIKKVEPCNIYTKYNVDYIIVYKKGDILTKNHELQHAKFHMNKKYKEQVYSLWNSLTDKYKHNIIQLLKKMNYPDNEDILIDEFQAYYFTEKKNFFGKP